MRTSSHAPFYDLFKLIVAIILLLIFYFLMWNGSTRAQSPQPVMEASPLSLLINAAASSTASAPPPTESPTLRASASTNIPASSSTPPPPTESSTPSASASTNTPTPSSTPPPPTDAPIFTPSPTLPPVVETLPTPIVEIPSETDVCAAFSRARLQVGLRATILRRLNFRSSPGIRNNWILTNISGTQVEVIGGPECTRYQNGGAYLWWQIRLPNGMEGWSAEASAFGGFYFMEPAQ